MTSARTASGLLEREAELAELERAVGHARDGEGGVVIVEGPPGIGKTELVRAARRLGAHLGLTVLSARGSELERDFAFGVVRQLFQSPLGELPADQRKEALSGAAALAGSLLDDEGSEVSPGTPGDIFPLLHGLHWLTANLAVTQPLMLAVDDAHWADEPSLRFLHYLSGRIGELPVLAVVATRSTAPEAPVAQVESIRVEGTSSAIRPRQLAHSGAAALLGNVLGADPDYEFVGACIDASGGNPFYLTELARTLRSTGADPTSETAKRIGEISPEAVAGSVLARLGHMAPEALALARWTAVLGADAELRQAGELAELLPDEAARAADSLAGAAILEPGSPLRFVHPLVQAAIYEDLPAHERSRRHGAAARLLRAASAPAERVASHLLLTDASGDDTVVESLIEAAAQALARGAPASALSLLRRALAEPPNSEAMGSVLLAAGQAARANGDSEAISFLEEAIRRCGDPVERAALSRELATTMILFGELHPAADVLQAAIKALPVDRREEHLFLEAELLTVELLAGPLTESGIELTRSSIDRIEDLLDGVSGKTPAERVLLAGACFHRMWMPSEKSSDLAELAERAVADGSLVQEVGAGSPYWAMPALAMLMADRHDEASALIETVETNATRTGSATGLAVMSMMRARQHLIQGNLRDAEADADGCFEIAPEGGPIILHFAAGTLLLVLIEEDRGEEALAWLEDRRLTRELAETSTHSTLLLARSALHRERGDLLEALRDAEEVEARESERGGVMTLPAALCSHALTYHASGDQEKALQVALRYLDAARNFALPSFVGSALLVLGMVESGPQRLVHLEQAAATLAGTHCTLNRARALIEYGAELRRANQRSDSREPLSQGLDLALRCGATGLAEQARTELKATGARPRSIVVSGVDSLTPSERRVAKLAAQGLTNRAIAQNLFVTMKTVETHLRHCYQKLEIAGREELAGKLEGDGDR